MAPVQLGPVTDIPENTARAFTVAGHRIAVVNAGGTFYAMDDRCSHAEAALSEGEVDEDELTLECPLHGSLFALETGTPRTLPAFEPVATYPVTVQDGLLFVEYSA